MKVNQIIEAQYSHKAQKNSLEWFLGTFFEVEEVEQLSDVEYEATFYLKDDFKAEDDDGYPIHYVIANYEDEPEVANPQWHPSKSTTWFIKGESDHTPSRVKDPRNELIIWYVKDAWPPAKRKINEARYQEDGGPGSLRWFLRNFCTQLEDDGQYREGNYREYEVNPEFHIYTRDSRNVTGIEVWDTDDGYTDHSLMTAQKGRNPIGGGHENFDNLTIYKVKKIWGPE